jgi:hypothetical protein
MTLIGTIMNNFSIFFGVFQADLERVLADQRSSTRQSPISNIIFKSAIVWGKDI